MDPSPRNWATTSLSELCRYIVERYHARIREDLPGIECLLREAREEAGVEETYLDTLLRGWRALASELRAHLEKEEAALFPLLGRLEGPDGGDTGVTEALLDGLGREHDDAAMALLSMARLTRGFQAPEGASPVLRELYRRLDRFDAELREHVALENDVLLPRARILAGTIE